ncbi:hypothetical protein KAW48_10425 [candidate division WOR-3 bacterium]|nr:hypothetical protein [candidate division WOR-3 bacterium]
MTKDITNALVNSVNSLHKNFQESHQKRLDEKNQERVWQGRGKSLSSVFEMETAKNISEVHPKYHFLVDYPISIYKGERRLRTIYPDILILKNFNPKKNDKCEVVAIIDLKIDLGYANMEYYEEKTDKKFSSKEKQIEEASICKFNYIVGGYSKEEKKLNVEIGKLEAKMPGKGKLKKIFIICTKGNDHSRSEKIEKILKKKEYNVLFLLDDKNLHPNSFEDMTKAFKKHIEGKKSLIEKAFRGL